MYLFGDNVTLRLSNLQEITATVDYIIDEESSKIIVFKITNGIESLASYRKITFDIIWWNYSGLKVPNDALMKETTKNGEEIYSILRNRMGYTDKILVKILKQNDSYSIITNFTNDELKTNYGYSDEEIKIMKNIVLYDEIIINPKT